MKFNTLDCHFIYFSAVYMAASKCIIMHNKLYQFGTSLRDLWQKKII